MRKSGRALWLIFSTAFRASPWLAFLAFVVAPITRAGLLANGIALKYLTEAVVAHDGRRIMVVSAALGAWSGLRWLIGSTEMKVRLTLSERTGHALQRRIVETAALVPGVEHYERPEYLDRLELLRNNQWQVGMMANSLVHNLASMITLGGSVALLVAIDASLLLLLAAGVPATIASLYFTRRHRLTEEATAPDTRLAEHLWRTSVAAGPAKEVRVFNLQQSLLRRQREAYERVHRANGRVDAGEGVFGAIGWALQAAAFAAAIWYVLRLAARGQASVGDVTLVVVVGQGVAETMTFIVGWIGWLQMMLRTAGRIVWLIDYGRAQRRSRGTQPAPEAISDAIDLDHVSFQYPESEALVLDDVSLRFPAGKVVALVGENGAGKTSLIKLLTGMYEPTGGTIRIDGADLHDVDLDSWRAKTSAGFQDFARLELMAAETVGVGDLEHVEERAHVVAALGRAGAADVPGRLVRGLDTQLGKQWEGGTELSGGQWQKLALGRAFMRERPLLLVLDEPTSALDAQTEHDLFERYAAAKRPDAVTVLVSHRFSTVRMADIIVVLERGRVRETGSHDELIALGGVYAELYEIQARAYR